MRTITEEQDVLVGSASTELAPPFGHDGSYSTGLDCRNDQIGHLLRIFHDDASEAYVYGFWTSAQECVQLAVRCVWFLFSKEKTANINV